MGASGSTFNVGFPTEGNTLPDDKTHTCEGANHSLVASTTAPVGVSRTHGPMQSQGSQGWVDAVVSTPLFANGRALGTDRQARHQKRKSKFRVFSDGVLFDGPDGASTDSTDLGKDFERLVGRSVTRVLVGDKRAQQVLVAFSGNKFWAVPSRQSFSRHSGVCLILGDKNSKGAKHKLQVGDILRLGSVGFLVSEMHKGPLETDNQVVSQDVLSHIREEIDTAPRQVLAPRRDELNPLEEGEEEVAEEVHNKEEVEVNRSFDETGVCRYQCYICLESTESPDNVLIAPCQCKGSTGLVHIKCLQRLISTGDAHKTEVVSTRQESHTCRICKARYKTHVKLGDGSLVPLLNPTLMPPYLTLIVITRHDSQPDLFNTIFQLSFSRSHELTLGRSQGSDVVIGYRTVSTRHGTISYHKGDFYYQDAKSSNGSLLYLRAPLELPYGKTVQLRMGRSVLSLRARRSLQLSTLPQRTAMEAIRWMSSSMRRTTGMASSDDGAGGGGSDSSQQGMGDVSQTSAASAVSRRSHMPPGAELMQCLYDGSMPSGVTPSRSIEEAIEQMNQMVWSHLDSSSESGGAPHEADQHLFEDEEEEKDEKEDGDNDERHRRMRHREEEGDLPYLAEPREVVGAGLTTDGGEEKVEDKNEDGVVAVDANVEQQEEGAAVGPSPTSTEEVVPPSHMGRQQRTGPAARTRA